MNNAELKARKDAATPRGVGVTCDFFAERAENAELWDIEGRRFIDFASGIAVNNTGHRHPKIVAAIRAQLDRFTHTAYQVVPYASYVELAEKINRRAPGDAPKKTAFFTTGAEAVENAIKIARAATGRPGVIASVMLGLGRALGETMAVTFVIGNTNLLDNVSLFSPGNSITSALANEFAEAGPGLHTAALMELGLILFVITFIVLAISKLMLLRLEKGEGTKR